MVDRARATQSSIPSEWRREAGRASGGSGNGGDDGRVVLRGWLQLRSRVPDRLVGTLPIVGARTDKAASYGQVVATLRPDIRLPGISEILGLGIPIRLRTQTRPRHASQWSQQGVGRQTALILQGRYLRDFDRSGSTIDNRDPMTASFGNDGFTIVIDDEIHRWRRMKERWIHWYMHASSHFVSQQTDKRVVYFQCDDSI